MHVSSEPRTPWWPRYTEKLEVVGEGGMALLFTQMRTEPFSEGSYRKGPAPGLGPAGQRGRKLRGREDLRR